MSDTTPRIPLVLACTLTLTPLAASQAALSEVRGEDPFHGLGTSVASAGDRNGDGVEDYWAGSPNPWGYGPSGGFVRLYSGADGATLRDIHARGSGEWFGSTLATGGDADGDGISDVAVGAPEFQGGMGAAYVFRGRAPSDAGVPASASAPEPWLVVRGVGALDRVGASILFVGDLDDDGASDLALGIPGDDEAGAKSGAVRVVSGRTGELLWEVGGAAGSELGTSLAQVGDLDADGVADLWVGAPGGGAITPGAGAVLFLSARTGAPLGGVEGDAAGDRFGHAVARAGRLDDDDRADGVVGAPGGSYVRAFAADASEIFTRVESPRSTLENWAPLSYEGRYGAAVLGIGDQNGDGRDDVAVAYPAHSGVWVLSGVDGAILDRVASSHQPSKFVNPMSVFFGHALARLEDVSGDGRPELLVGAPHDFEQLSGQSTVEWDVGAVDVVSVATDAAWVRDVRELAGAGDIDGDGHADVAYALQNGVLEIRSGRDGSVLRSWTNLPPIAAIAPAGDVNGDGRPDLVVGAAGVRVLSGADGAELWSATGNGSDGLGLSVAGLGDLDGDGFDDVGAGAPYVSTTTFAGCNAGPGYVRVYSGATGGVLLQVDGRGIPNWNCSWGPRSEGFGLSLASAGDWNRDGTPDFAVGAPGAEGSSFTYGGQVRVFSGVDGALLEELDGIWGDSEFGISIDGGSDFDVDADGFVDLVVGEQLVGYGPYAVTQGRAVVFSSQTGAPISSVQGTPPPLGYGHLIGPGYAVAAVGDFDRDGHADYAFGNPTAPGVLGPGVGEILVVSGRTGAVLLRHEGVSSWDYLGYALAAVGDTDGDGTDDVLGLAWGSIGTSLPTSFARSRVYHGRASAAAVTPEVPETNGGRVGPMRRGRMR